MQEVLQCLGVNKTRTTSLQPQLNCRVDRSIKTVEEHLKKVVASHQRDGDARVPIFLLAYWASTDIMSLIPASLVFGRELSLPCGLLFGASFKQQRPTIDHEANLVDHLHEIHNYAHQHLKLSSEGMKTRYDKLARSVWYHEVYGVWLYRPTRTKGKTPKPQSSWDGPY
jgi:hypothetical protein